MLTSWFTYDFGYSWPFTWGHLIVCLVGLALAALFHWRGWSRWTVVAALMLAVWGLAGSLAMHYAVQINAPHRVPTASFLPSGSGRALDLGAGSGRATVGLLLARPEASVTAVDLYQGYYGIDDNSPERLKRNARIAGVDQRLEVRVADMRELPFSSGEFDAAMSVAAIDHLQWPDVERALREVARVLKPGGQLLIVSLNPDAWVRIAMPASIHGGYWGQAANRDRWRQAMTQAGFDVTEVGTRPATVYFLGTSRPAQGTPHMR